MVIKQLTVTIDFQSRKTIMEVDGYHQLSGNQHSSKCHIWCSIQERNSNRFGTTRV